MNTLKELRIFAQSKNCEIVFNRSLCAYQVKREGFIFSEPVYASRDKRDKLYLSESDLLTIKSYIS